MELAHVPPRGAEGRREGRVEGAVQVLRSLPKNSREVFRLLSALLREAAWREGVPLNHLFDRARAGFLVASLGNLRTHLREFTDHTLVRVKKGRDGADLLVIELPEDQLDKVLGGMDLETQ